MTNSGAQMSPTVSFRVSGAGKYGWIGAYLFSSGVVAATITLVLSAYAGELVKTDGLDGLKFVISLLAVSSVGLLISLSVVAWAYSQLNRTLNSLQPRFFRGARRRPGSAQRGQR